MQNLPSSPDAYINLAAAIIALVTALITLVPAILSKVRTKEDKTKALAYTLVWSDIALLVAGTILTLFGLLRFGLPFFILATLINFIGYASSTTPARRSETLVLIVHWSGACLLITFNLSIRILDVLGRTIDMLEKLIH